MAEEYNDDGRHHSQEAVQPSEQAAIDGAAVEYSAPPVAPAGPLPGPPPGPLVPAERFEQAPAPPAWTPPATGQGWSEAFGAAAPPVGKQSRPVPAAPRRPTHPDQSGAPAQHMPSDYRAPGPPARPAAPPQPVDHYRRSSAPTQAAGASFLHELVTSAAEESSPQALTGYRAVLNKMGLKLGPGPKERHRRDLHRRIRAPKDSMYSIAVVTLKGGAGKTTVTSTLGQVFASIRSDGVIAVDADPSAGDLPLRTAIHPRGLSVVDMLKQQDLNQRDYVIRYLSTTDADLQVLANGWRADSDEVLEPEDIRDVHLVAKHYYSLLLWDCDANLHSPLVREVLANSDAVVLLVQASNQGAIAAANAVDWLRFHGFEGLLQRTVLLVNRSSPRAVVDMDRLHSLLQRQQLKIHQVPFDHHLDEGRAVELNKLDKKTLLAFEELAAILADDFVTPQAPVPAPAAS